MNGHRKTLHQRVQINKENSLIGANFAAILSGALYKMDIAIVNNKDYTRSDEKCNEIESKIKTVSIHFFLICRKGFFLFKLKFL